MMVKIPSRTPSVGDPNTKSAEIYKITRVYRHQIRSIWTKSRLKQEFSYEEIEREILDMVNDLFARLAGSLLEEVLGNKEVQRQIRRFGGKLAYRFVGYQEVTIRLANEWQLKVRSPYFVKAKPKRGPNGRGCHLLLELLGFMGRCSVLFVSDVVQMALPPWRLRMKFSPCVVSVWT